MNHRRNDNQGTQALCDAPAVAFTEATTPASPLRYYGGLQSFARQIVDMMPRHDFYAEPFAGGLSVLLSKPVRETECISDINADLVNFWQVVQRPGTRRRLIQQLEMTPYSRVVFKECIGVLENGERDSVRRAWSLLVRCNQSRNGAGTHNSWAYEKGVANKKADSWARLPARIELAGRRLRRTQIECLPYQETLRWLDKPKTVLFLDPPFIPSTRVAPKIYLHEFCTKEHERLLYLVGKLKKAKVILCGYRSELYRTRLEGWRRTDIETKSFAALRGKGSKRDERVLSIWTNYDPQSK